MTSAEQRRLFIWIWKQAYGDEGVSPDALQVYDNLDRFMGFSSEVCDEDRFRATLVLAMTHTLRSEGTDSRLRAENPVHFFIPKSIETWVLTQARGLAESAVVKLRTLPQPAKEFQWSLLKDAIRHLKLEVRPWAVEEEPWRWVVFGYKKDSPLLPMWVREKMSTVRG